MKKRVTKSVWEQIGEKHGVCSEEVRSEIESAIQLTLSQLRYNHQNDLLKCWNRIPKTGTEPTPEELVAYLAFLAHTNATP